MVAVLFLPAVTPTLPVHSAEQKCGHTSGVWPVAERNARNAGQFIPLLAIVIQKIKIIKVNQMKKSDLLTALEIVKPGLANKEIVDQATSFAFIDGGVTTFNNEISISHPVTGVNIEGAIQASELYQFLKKVKVEEIEMETTDNEIILKAGRSRAGLIRQAEIKLPLKEINEHKNWQPIPEHFLKAIEMTSGVCAQSVTKPIMNSVHICDKGYVEGSDNYRIMRHRIGKLPMKTFLIPSGSAKELLKLDLVEMAEGKGWVYFRSKTGTVISCRMFADKYPNTDTFLKVTGTEITFPADIREILERAEIFCNSTKIADDTVEITLKSKRLLFSSKSDTGWFKESVETDYNGAPITFLITPTLFRNILNETKSGVLSERFLKFQGVNWEYVGVLKVKP